EHHGGGVRPAELAPVGARSDPGRREADPAPGRHGRHRLEPGGRCTRGDRHRVRTNRPARGDRAGGAVRAHAAEGDAGGGIHAADPRVGRVPRNGRSRAMSPVATPERDVHAREYARPALPRFVDVLRSEWTKLRSLRSTWFTLAATLAVTVGVGALVAGGVAEEFRDMSADDRASFIPTADAYFVGCLIGSIAIAVLGVLSFSGEHG